MKTLGGAASKSADSETAEAAPSGDNNGFFTANDKIDFSNVKVEPLFEGEVDFDTFSKQLENTPIIIMLLNDSDNRLYDSLLEYDVLDKLDDLNRNKYDRYYQADFGQAENNLKDEFAELKKQRIHLGANGTEEIKMRMPMYLTSVFEELYPDAIPFSFDGFVTKGNNLGGKGGTYYCTIVKMLLSNSVNETTIHNFASDVRNRIEALLMTTNATSWKCIDQEFRVIPPEEKRARKVYDSIVTKINENKEYACKDIFDRFCRPPYGMSEDVVVLMIAVVCANLNYCLRFRCDESLTNINSWKELVVIKDKKIDIDVVKKSAFVMVDAGAVTGKYVRFFERIQSNKSISEVISLEKILANMMAVDEIPEELETQYLLARKYLDSGKKANNEWKTCIGEIDEKLEASIEESNLYDALKGLQLVEAIPYTKIFKDNGYELDEESKNTVKELISSLKSEVEQLITPYLANMYCKSVEGVNTFRNHNTKMQNMLEELGFTNYAMQVKRRKEDELSNIDEIRSRQELRADCEKYLEESQITRYVTYVNVCLYLKSGKELQARVEKYGVALGKDAQKIQENINDRVAALEKNHDRTMQDMSDIWDRRAKALRVRETEDLETGEKTAQLNFKGPKLDDASMTRREMETNVGDGGTVRAILEQIGFTPVIPVEKVHYFHRGRLTACVDQVTGLGEFLELEILTESEEGRSAALTEIEEVLRQIGHSMEDTTRISYLSQLCSKLENEI